MKKLLLLSMFGLIALAPTVDAAHGQQTVNTSGVACVLTPEDDASRQNAIKFAAAINEVARKKGLTEGTLAALCSLVTGTGYIVDKTLAYGASYGVSALAMVGALFSTSGKYCFSKLEKSSNAQAVLGLIMILALIEGADRYNLLPETADHLWDSIKKNVGDLGLRIGGLNDPLKQKALFAWLKTKASNMLPVFNPTLEKTSPNATATPNNSWSAYLNPFNYYNDPQ